MNYMELPEPELYSEVDSNTILPPFTKHNLNEFLHRFGKKGNIGKHLYNRRFLSHVSVAYVGVDVFLKGSCIGVRKQYTANVRIGEDGDVGETCCECCTRQGNKAHCDHIIGLLYGAKAIAQEGPLKLNKVKRRPASLAERAAIENDGIVFNPVPQCYRKLPDYNDWVRNVCMTFGPSSMPIKQLFAPEEVDSLLWDHSYGKSGSS